MQTKKTDPIYEFYTSHPYPPPIDNLDRAREMWQDENIHRAEHHLLWPHKEYRPDLNVLVAGCGTWQAAKHAICHPAAHVVAIDVSPTSLQHTDALKQKYDLTNLETRQLSIENVAELDQSFDLIEVLKLLPQHHPLLATQGGSREFLNGDALADALLNPRDRSYSVPQLFDFIERNDLQFGRWYWQAAYLPQCGSISSTAHVERLAALPERDQYIEMELWRGLMSNHSVVAYRNDMNLDRVKINFDDDSCLRYVPIRLPWTLCVQEQLPPGAAGVLLNQTHLFSDLLIVIDPQQKQMFDAIDGRRSILQIIEAVKASGPRARDFFQQLWLYDQVVFDTSKAQ